MKYLRLDFQIIGQKSVLLFSNFLFGNSRGKPSKKSSQSRRLNCGKSDHCDSHVHQKKAGEMPKKPPDKWPASQSISNLNFKVGFTVGSSPESSRGVDTTGLRIFGYGEKVDGTGCHPKWAVFFFFNMLNGVSYLGKWEDCQRIWAK